MLGSRLVALLLRGLLVDVGFGATLESLSTIHISLTTSRILGKVWGKTHLALVMLSLPLLLLGAITRETGDGAAHGPGHAVSHAGAEVVQLAARLLALALAILLLSFFLQALEAEGAADGLLARADGLVPRAGLTVRVVRGDARGGDGHAADAGAGVGELVAGVGGGLLVLTCVLREDGVSSCKGQYLGDGCNHTLSAVLPVREPRADWAMPLAWSR